MLSTTSADGQLCCWDLAVERDPEEEMLMADKNNANVPSDIPPQLLFVHGGQSDVKEVIYLIYRIHFIYFCSRDEINHNLYIVILSASRQQPE